MARVVLSFFAAGLVAIAVGVAPADPADAFETDRPAELENPYSQPPGQSEWVNYVVAMNAAARKDLFGSGGSGSDLDSALRFGLALRLEGDEGEEFNSGVIAVQRE